VLVLAALAFAPQALVDAGAHHTRHLQLLGKGLPKINREVLAAVDRVQATALDGGGYFIGVKAVPAESPIGYALKLKGVPMLTPSRSTSYCSGSSYSALIEALDRLLKRPLDAERSELMRMQEPDGSRREDEVKAWGWWNADGLGCDYALVQYLGIGERIKAADARPGDFMNISWKSGLGHSVVFLGWIRDARGPSIAYWSSQKGTNGLGDQISPLSSVAALSAVRLAHPERLLTFTPGKVDRKAAPSEPALEF
jgi:hypothetical protein